MTFNLVGQILTFVSYFIYWLSRFRKTKRSILLVDNLSRLFTIASFICLGSLNGIQNTIYSGVRNIVGQRVTEKSKYKAFVIMLIISILIYALSFNGWSTVIIFACALCNLYGVILCDEQGIRKWGIVGGFIYIGFQFLIANYIGCICEFIGIIVTYISYKKNCG